MMLIFNIMRDEKDLLLASLNKLFLMYLKCFPLTSLLANQKKSLLYAKGEMTTVGFKPVVRGA